MRMKMRFTGIDTMLIGSRNINVRVDLGSWTSPAAPPAAIAALNGMNWSADIDAVLAHIALWTRPPTINGFDLSDLWAWFRYGRAIDGGPDLRLIDLWEDIDAHQKTLLSDDFGVGLNALLLVERLGMQFLGETRYVVDVLRPGEFNFLNWPKQGPAKSPDFIVTDDIGECHAVEFKGTQSTRRVLASSMESGVAQKQNLIPAMGASLGSSLVMGVFVPQNSSAERALLRIRDPEIGDLGKVLREIPSSDIRDAIVQITLAKCFAILGLPEHALLLSKTSAAELKNLPGSRFAEREFGAIRNNNELLRHTVDWEEVVIRRRQVSIQKGTDSFTAELPVALFNELHEASSVGAFIHDLSTRTLKLNWKVERSQAQVIILSPLGLKMTLS